MGGIKRPRLRILRFATLLSTGIFAIPGFAEAFSREIGIGMGTARFHSSRDNQTEGNQQWQGSLQFDQYLSERFFVGVLADFTINFCPICDNSPDDVLKTVSLVAGPLFKLKPFQFQAGLGIGIASGEDGVIEAGGEVTESFNSINIPILSKAMYWHEFQGFGIGIGVGMKYHLNFENNVLGSSLLMSVLF